MEHGIIGCGRIAKNHIYGVKEAGHSIKWCCDLDMGKAREIATNNLIPFYTNDYHKILNDNSVSTISILTDHQSHSEIAIDSIKKGKHVILEKPISINIEDAELIQKELSRTNLKLTVCFQHRFNPIVQGIRNLVKKDKLGEITLVVGKLKCSKDEEYYNGWRGKLISEGGSTLINQAIHTLDLMIWIMGEPKVISAKSGKLKFTDNETEDTLTSIFSFPNGSLGSLNCTNTSNIEWESSIEITGTKGTIEFSADRPNGVLKCSSEDDLNLLKKLNEKEVEQYRPGLDYFGVSHRSLIDNFFKSVSGYEDLLISVEDALRTQKAVDEIYKLT